MPSPLLTTLDSDGHIHLIIGSNPLANARCTKSLEAGAKPKVIAPEGSEFHYILQKRIEDGEVEWIKKTWEDGDLSALGRPEVEKIVDAVFVTSGRESASNTHISQLCRRKRIPINVVDAPRLCTFTLLCTHSDGPLQIGITTSGKGCKLASRIRREVVSSLPKNFGATVERLGTIRRRIWEEDHRDSQLEDSNAELEDDDATAQKSNFNQFISESDASAARTRRMRWLSQICEYWSLSKLASIEDCHIDTILKSYASNKDSSSLPPENSAASPARPKPEIILAGAGPGSVSLLTLATYRAIQNAPVVLVDKLVPAPIQKLIPRRSHAFIAEKFPGNADTAQDQLHTLALEALEKGHTVLRLKQGDPYVYGRGGEEYNFFREKGYTPIVLPGITSALSAPLFAGIPPTHRSVADQVLVCTGRGRKGVAPKPPPYNPTQTVIFLMSLNRLSSLVEELTGGVASANRIGAHSEHQLWPPETPCAIVERASCPDQRVIRSTLEHVSAAFEQEGSRPPGLLVVGSSCKVLVDMKDRGKWVVEEGFSGLGSMEFDPELGLEAFGNKEEDAVNEVA